MKRLIFPILVLFILIITSCEFVPEEVPEAIIENRGIPPPVKFNLNNYNDTIKLGSFTEFSYSLNAYETNILSVKINLGERTLINYIKGQNQQSLYFEINPAYYNNGNYLLQIEIVAGSGTGSIADKLDAEGYIFKIDWPIMIDKTHPNSNSCILRAGYTKKAIDLNWEPFNHLLFKSYTIYRTTKSLLYKPVKVAEINEKFLTTFTDTSFWNGEMNYYFLRINTPTGYSEGEMVGVYDSITGLKAELRNDGTVSVRWDKAENIESFGGYYVYSYFNSSSILEKYYINDPNQSYAILSTPGFAYGLNIRLKFIPKDVNENNYTSITGTSIKFYPMPVLPEHLKSYPVNGRDFILIAKTGKLYRYLNILIMFSRKKRLSN